MISHKTQCFCAFCKSPHWVYRRKRLGPFHFLLSLMTASVVSLILFGQILPPMILFFVFCLVIVQVFLQIRWRMSLTCRRCGFDPILYRKDTAKAAGQVKDFLEKRKNSVSSLFAQPLNLPTLSPERAEALKKIEQVPRLSKQI